MLDVKKFLPFIGPLIGITGVSLAVYYHSLSVQERAPMFYVGTRATIVDASIPTPSQLQILYKGKPVGATNVVALVIYVWNEGKLPIRNADVLEPISIQLDPSCEILESRILKVGRGVSGFEKQEPSDAAKNKLPLSFNILEKGDGAAVQIIYAGKSDAAIAVTGTVVGAGMPRALASEKRFTTRTNRENLRTSLTSGYLFLGFGMLMMAYSSFFFWWRIRKEPSNRAKHLKRWWIMLGLSILYCSASLYLIRGAYKAYSPGVPTSIWLEN